MKYLFKAALEFVSPNTIMGYIKFYSHFPIAFIKFKCKERKRHEKD